MIQFRCDYVEGCHPKILDKLVTTNLEQTSGYGTDEYTARAKESVLSACGCPDGEVHFLVGGTQTNTTVISALLRPYQGVISSEEGHIATHESGAIEATGHKVICLPTADGTITAKQVDTCLREHYADGNAEHLVQPGMVYISFPTERGTLYTRKALEEMYAVCRHWDVPLFIDGARMGYGLASPECDVKLKDFTSLCDVFYIGGTKCGALFGEAVVMSRKNYIPNFRYYIKQRGGMLAKGRLLGLQFEVLFEDDLYLDICGTAVKQALEIREAFDEKGIPIFGNSPTNQQFVILTKEQLELLNQKYQYEIFIPMADGGATVRFCTSWATTQENVDALIKDIQNLL